MKDFEAFLTAQLEERRRADLYRRRITSEGPAGVEVRVGDRVLLSFCSNDYLGLANHPDLAAALSRGAARYGVGSGAAHLVTGHTRAHHALEEELAEFFGRPRALIFSTGYMANLGAVTALAGPGDAVFQDRLNHASLLDAGLLSRARLVRYAHGDADALSARLGASRAERKLVVTDGVFSMDGDIAPLDRLVEVARKQDAWLMVDDAHGLGVLGQQGAGSVSHFGLGLEDVPVLMGTLGKALGTAGAFVAGSEALVETLIQRARPYIYTTAMPAALAEATRTSLRLMRNEQWRRDRLAALVRRFREGARSLGLPLTATMTPIQPLLVGSPAAAMALSEALYQRGILISAIRPPTVPENTARLRITFSAVHDEQHVDRLLSALDEVWPTSAGIGPA